jgi:type IV pilus assembly protein PilO
MTRLEEAFYLATRALPDKKEIPSLLKSVSRAGSSAGLNFVLFQPEPEVNRDFYREIPLSMKVEGNYHQIADFFFQVSRLNRIVNIRNISLRRNKAASGVIDMDCSAVTYMFVEIDQNAKQNKKKKKS